MAEVKAHPWLAGPVPTLAEIQHEFAQRKLLIDKENEAKRQQKEAEKAMREQAAHAGGRRQYRNVGVHRSETAEGGEEAKHDLVLRKCDQYFGAVAKNTEFFSTIAPEDLFGEIAATLQEKGHLVTLDPKKYKLKATLKTEEEDEDEEEEEGDAGAKEQEEDPVQMTVKILDAGEGKYCVEFSRTAGDQLCFFEAYNRLHSELADLANAVRA